MIFDKKIDLTAEVYFHFYNIGQSDACTTKLADGTRTAL